MNTVTDRAEIDRWLLDTINGFREELMKRGTDPDEVDDILFDGSVADIVSTYMNNALIDDYLEVWVAYNCPDEVRADVVDVIRDNGCDMGLYERIRIIVDNVLFDTVTDELLTRKLTKLAEAGLL